MPFFLNYFLIIGKIQGYLELDDFGIPDSSPASNLEGKIFHEPLKEDLPNLQT